jgi:hypothetical protein
VGGRPGLAGLAWRRRAGEPDRLAPLVADRLALRLFALLQGVLMRRR